MSKKNLMYLATGIAFLVFALCIAYIFTEPSSTNPMPQEAVLQEQDASGLQTGSLPQTPPPTDSLVFSAQNNETPITAPPPARDIPRIDPAKPVEEIKPVAERAPVAANNVPNDIPETKISGQEEKPAPIFKENEPVTEKLIPLDNDPIKLPPRSELDGEPQYDPVKEAQNSAADTQKSNAQPSVSETAEEALSAQTEKSVSQSSENDAENDGDGEKKRTPLQDKLPVPFADDSLKTKVILAPDKKINTVVYAEMMMDGDRVGLVFEGNKPIKPKTFRLQNPDRVVVDIEGFWKLKLPQLISNRMVKEVRFNAQKDKTRIVFDLKIPATSTLLYRIHSRKYQLVFK